MESEDVFPEANKTEEVSKRLKPGEVFEEAAEAPIEPGTVFDPEEELKEVLKVSGKAREVKFAAYKDKYTYQKEGLAKMQQAIRDRIVDYQEVSEEELFMLAGDYGAKYGFSPGQLIKTAYAVREYEDKHKAVQEVLSRFATEKDGRPTIDTEKLFEAAFLKNPLARWKFWRLRQLSISGATTRGTSNKF